MNILVTGGSSGLGRAVVEQLCTDKGNTVYFTYRSNGGAAAQLTAAYPNAVAHQCDFAYADSVDALLEAMPAWDLDVLVNNAWSGEPQGVNFHKQPADDFAESFRINILPAIRITQKAVEGFRKKKSGKIITVLTAALLNVPPTGYSVYAAGKAYLAQLAKSWSREYVKFNVTSNCISPNFMQTPLTGNTDRRIVEMMEAEHPLGRLLLPQEAARCVRFLVYAPSQVNGVDIPVNAGINIL